MDQTKALTQLERDVLDWILRGDDPVRAALRQQLMAASVSDRHFTGVGFYVHLVVPDSVPRLDESLGTKPRFTVTGVGATFEDANVEVGFVLFVRDGRLHMLEGYTYGSEAWPEPEGKYRLCYYGGSGRINA